MNKKPEMKLGFALLIIASLFCGSVHAQIPVTDSQNTKSTIKNWFTNLKESKVVVSTMNTAKKTSAAIGTAKKAVSEYVLENKKKIEEKMAKVKEYKEKVEKYKKDYEEYKKQLDEGIAKAKELKQQAEEGIQTAKDTAAAAKGIAAAAKDTVNSKIGSVSDKLGIESGNSGSASAVAPAAETEAPSAEQASSAVRNTAVSAVQSKPAVASAAAVSTTRRPFTGAGAGTSAGSVVSAEQSVVSSGSGLSAQIQPVAVAAQPQAAAAVMTDAVAAQAVPAAAVLNGAEVSSTVSMAEPAVVAAPEAASAGRKTSVQLKDAASVGALPAADAQVKALKAAELPQAELTKSAAVPAAVRKLETSDSAAVPAASVRDAQKAVPLNSQKTQRKSLRRTFTTSSREGAARINAAVPVAFAYALELPDDCSDVNNTRLFPRATCMYCGLSSAKVKESGAVDECLQSINLESSKAQAYSGRDAPRTYRKGKLEIAAVMIAESYRAANKAETFYDNKVAPIAEAPEGVEQDALSNLVEFNKVVDEQLNDLLQLYSSRLALQSYLNYGKYRFKPEDAEDEE